MTKSVQRFKKACLLALILSAVQFVFEWVGYGRKWNSTGEIQPLREIWWHFPLGFVMILVLALWLLPREVDPQAGPHQDK